MNDIYICPRCGKFMDSHIEYNYGNVFVRLYCSCGYTNKDCRTGIQTNRTDYKNITNKISSSTTVIKGE